MARFSGAVCLLAAALLTGGSFGGKARPVRRATGEREARGGRKRRANDATSLSHVSYPHSAGPYLLRLGDVIELADPGGQAYKIGSRSQTSR